MSLDSVENVTDKASEGSSVMCIDHTHAHACFLRADSIEKAIVEAQAKHPDWRLT